MKHNDSHRSMSVIVGPLGGKVLKFADNFIFVTDVVRYFRQHDVGYGVMP